MKKCIDIIFKHAILFNKGKSEMLRIIVKTDDNPALLFIRLALIIGGGGLFSLDKTFSKRG